MASAQTYGRQLQDQAQVQIACSIVTRQWVTDGVYEAFLACKAFRGTGWPYDIWSVANVDGLLNLWHYRPAGEGVWVYYFPNAGPGFNTMTTAERNTLASLNPVPVLPGQQIYWVAGPAGGIGVTPEGELVALSGTGNGNGEPQAGAGGLGWLAAAAGVVAIVALTVGKKVV